MRKTVRTRSAEEDAMKDLELGGKTRALDTFPIEHLLIGVLRQKIEDRC